MKYSCNTLRPLPIGLGEPVRGTLHQAIERARLLLLAVALLLCVVPTAQAIRCPTPGPALDSQVFADGHQRLNEVTPSPERDAYYAVWVVDSQGRIGLFVGNNPISFVDPLGLKDLGTAAMNLRATGLNPSSDNDFYGAMKIALGTIIAALVPESLLFQAAAALDNAYPNPTDLPPETQIGVMPAWLGGPGAKCPGRVGFSNGNFGNQAHQRFLDALRKQTGTLARDWRMSTAPYQTGVDATYIGPASRYPGFSYAELKPLSPSTWPTFIDQLGKWGLPAGKTQLWLYNSSGTIGSSGFNF